MNDKIKAAIDFVLRHAVWGILGAISLIFLRPGLEEIQTIFFIVICEAMAIALSGLALFAYTKIDFTKTLLQGTDNEFSDSERQGMYQVISFVFLGVHVLMGLIVLGVYIAQFSH